MRRSAIVGAAGVTQDAVDRDGTLDAYPPSDMGCYTYTLTHPILLTPVPGTAHPRGAADRAGVEREARPTPPLQYMHEGMGYLLPTPYRTIAIQRSEQCDTYADLQVYLHIDRPRV